MPWANAEVQAVRTAETQPAFRCSVLDLPPPFFLEGGGGGSGSRQGFSVWLWLSTCLYLPSAGIKGVHCHYCLVDLVFLTLTQLYYIRSVKQTDVGTTPKTKHLLVYLLARVFAKGPAVE